MAYQVIDAYGSVITIESSIVSGANRQVVAANLSLGNTSVSGTVGASIVGLPHVQIAGSVAAIGSVVAYQGGAWSASLISAIPSSIIVGASIFGQLPAGTAPIGSVAVLQGTMPWIVNSVYGNFSGSVVGFQGGTWQPSAIGYLKRNDALASTLGADGTYGEAARDSAGRFIIKPFAADEVRVYGISSTVNTSITQLVGVAGAGLRNYLTDILVANTGSVVTQVTFRDGDASIIGRTVAPATSGSNIRLQTPIRTGGYNQQIDYVVTTAVSVLSVSGYGYKAP